MGIIGAGSMKSTAVAFLRESAIKASALERALKSPEFALFRASTTEKTVAAIMTAERTTKAMADVIFRERVMKAITVTIALLVIAIALPAIY